MARPRSEDKRNAILDAATTVFAAQGINAPTASIARAAGVAEGTLFTYFDSKDTLLNALYLELKAGMREAMITGYPRRASLRERAAHVWGAYVGWGVSFPAARKVMAQLAVSDRVTGETRTAGSGPFGDIQGMLREAMAKGALKDLDPDFVGTLLTAMAETTMDFITREPARAEHYRSAGFEAFWNAIGKA